MDTKPQEEEEEYNLDDLTNSLLGKEEEKKDDKPAEETKEEEKTDDTKPAEEKPADDTASNEESKPAEEDNRPLTREDIRAAMREEQQALAQASTQRQSTAGQIRAELKEALKLDSTFTTVSLDDGTPINSVSQLTQVINPETQEPYTREEAAQLLLEAQQIVRDNLADYDRRVDELTDLNLTFKEEADRVDALYGDILEAFPDVAKDLMDAYKKTFQTNEDGTYVTNVPISPLEFYGPALRPYRNATDQITQQRAEKRLAEEKAAKEVALKEEQEDRGDLGATAGSAEGKPNPLASALDKYLEDN